MLRRRNNLKGNKKEENVEYTCTIRFLDDSEPMHVSFQRETTGQWLLDYICRELNVLEKDYFGLRYVDADKQRIDDTKHVGLKEHWLDALKPVYKQMKNVNPLVLCFRVKFYPPDPMVLKEEITRYFLFLQLRRDLHHGRLLCTQPDASTLAAYIIQSEVGDYDNNDHAQGYVSSFNMLPKQTPKMEEKIAEIHKTLSGQVPSEAEGNFLKKAASLDTYGVDPYQVKDQKGNQLYLGVTHLGIVTFLGSKRSHLFRWPQVNRIAFEGKMFIVHVTIQEDEEEPKPKSKSRLKKKHAHGFKCQSYSACRQLWRVAVEQNAFFTLARSADAPKMSSGGGLFQRSSKFRFSGRCQKEVIQDSKNITRSPPTFVRSPSNSKYCHVDRSNTMPARLNRELADSVPAALVVEEVVFVRIDDGYDTMNSSHKDDNINLAETRDSVLMDFVIPEDNLAAVSSPPTPAGVLLDSGALLEPVMEADDAAPLAAEEDNIDVDEEEDEEAIDEAPIEYTQLDAEIESLKKELHKINNASELVSEEALMEKSNGACHAEPDLSPAVRKSRCSPLKAIMVTLGVSFFGLLVCLVLLVAFLEVPNDRLRQYQNHDAVRQLRHVYYDPLRAFVLQNVAKLKRP